MNGNKIIYFDSFGVEHIPKEMIKFIKNKNLVIRIYRIQAYDSIRWGYFCIGFINFLLNGKSLLDYTNLFSSNNYEKNWKIILKYFQQLKKMKKLYCITCSKYRKFEKLKISYILEKTSVVSIICRNCKNIEEKVVKEEESIEILKIPGLIENILLL